MIGVDDLRGFPLLAGLPDHELALLAGTAREVWFDTGERLFEEGAPADGCWLLLRGCVIVDAQVPGRGQVVVQSLGPGDVLGWSWLVPPRRWHFGALTAAPTAALRLDGDQLRALAEHDPAFGYRLATRLLSVLLDRLQTTRARLLDLYRSPDGAR
jgi:CRP-like cAMP-binding protein